MKKKLSVILAALLMLSTVLTAASCGVKENKEGNKSKAEESDEETKKGSGSAPSVSVGKTWEDDENLPVSDEDVVTTLENAIKNTLACDHISIEAEGKLLGSIDQQGLTANLNIPVTAYFKANADDPKNPNLGFKLDATLPEFLGGSMLLNAYLEDGVTYQVQNDEAYKVNSEKVDFDELRKTDVSFPPEIKEYLEGTNFVLRNDGSKSVTVDIDKSMLADLFDIPEDAIDLKRMKLKITVKNDVLSNVDFVGEATLNYYAPGLPNPLPIALGIEAEAVCTTPNSKISITPPEGYKDFPTYEEYWESQYNEESWDEDEYWDEEEYWDEDYNGDAVADSAWNGDYYYDYPAETEPEVAWDEEAYWDEDYYYDYPAEEAVTEAAWDYYDYYDYAETAIAEEAVDYYW